MKNTNKIVSIVVLLAVLIATVAGAYLGLAGRNTEMVTVTVDGVETERALYRQVAFIPNPVNDTWKEAIIPSAQLGGGLTYRFTCEQGEMSVADYTKAVKSAAKILGERVEMIAGDASVAYEGSNIDITVPVEEPDTLVEALGSYRGDVSFCLYDSVNGTIGDALMTNEHVKDAGYYSDENGYYLQVLLTKKGQKAFADVIAANPNGMMLVLLDGSPLGSFYLTANTDTRYINANVDDWTYALLAAVCLRTDTLPVALTLSNYELSEATLGGLLDGVVVFMGIVMLLAAVWMIIRCKLTGVIAALVLCAQGVLYSLFVALNAVSTSWKLSLSSLILLCICQLLFIAGLVLVIEAIRCACKHRGIKQAVTLSMKKNMKPLSIVYGALIVLGVLMMAIFGNTPAAYLGRMVLLSGLVSFAMIFVALRVLLGCVHAIKNK